ncbi:MAG: glycosyltransferase family 4 protein [Eubacterium sp.]|nr:glycosyltransferase family 4 protein [Eubacterium sp.]
MKVHLFMGSWKCVEKSGVGEAIHHQESMLNSMHIDVTHRFERDASLVHINTIFPSSFFASLFARLSGKTVLYYGHSTMEDFRNSFKGSNRLSFLFKCWIRFCYFTGNAIVTPTEYSKNLLLSYGTRTPIYVLTNGVDTDFFAPDPKYRRTFREKYGIRDDEKAVISVGHYMARKGIMEFIELAKAMPDVRFFWFGYTKFNLIPEEISEAIQNPPPNLVFPGYVGREELRDAYCGCDLFCFMSHEETEGIVVLEALASGIPVMVRDIPVYEGWLTDGENVYKGHDHKSFMEKAEAILEGRVPNLTKAGLKVAESHSIPNTGQKLMEIYQDVKEASREKRKAHTAL